MEANMLQVHEQLELLSLPEGVDPDYIEDLIINAETYLHDHISHWVQYGHNDHMWSIIEEITFYDQMDDTWIEEGKVVDAHMDVMIEQWWWNYVCEILYPHAKQIDAEGNLIALFGFTVTPEQAITAQKGEIL